MPGLPEGGHFSGGGGIAVLQALHGVQKTLEIVPLSFPLSLYNTITPIYMGQEI